MKKRKKSGLRRRYGHSSSGSLYEQLKAAGCAIDHHESDLYVRDSETARKIIKAGNDASRKANSGQRWATSTFTGTDGHRWIDIPFAYDPWWQKRSR